LLVAEDELSDEAIAERVGVTKQTLENWKRRPEFRAVVDGHKAKWAAELEQEGIANRQNRINAANERWHLMQQVIAERAADPTMTAPGSGTGLLAELRAHEVQAARELGQLVDKRELTGKDGGAIEVEHGGAIEVRAVDYRVTTATLHPLPAALVDDEGAA